MRARLRRQQQPATAWNVEVARFKALWRRWLDYRLNHFFDLTISGPRTRQRWVGLLGLGFVVGGAVLHIIFYYIPLLAPIRPFVLSDLPVFIVLTTARLVIVMFIPAFIAITQAGNYLADIFELKDPSVAWDYISTLSLTGWEDLLHILEGRTAEDRAPSIGPGSQKYIIRIRDGQVAKESLDSPALLIGGPGIVIAEFDSAALFEKPDGTPHVIGLASAVPDAASKPNVVLDGFERLREPIINLRDQYIGNLAGESMTVLSRSLDGIPISAADVRGMFSVIRHKPDDVAVSSIHAPYPFEPADIERLIYKQAVRVLNEGPIASSEPDRRWDTTMQGLIRSSLAEFMSQHKLGEYLAGIGALESELSEYREDTIASTTLHYASDLPDSTGQTPPPRKFYPRAELLDRFNRSSGSFAQRARDRGLQLHWVNVGTWRMPDELGQDQIRDRHQEAWRLNRENARQSSPENLERSAQDAYYNEKVRLIQRVPLEAQQKNKAKYSEKSLLVECLLQDFWEQIGDGLTAYYDNPNHPPELETIEKAVLRMERLLKVQRGHMIGGGSLSKVRTEPGTSMEDETPPAPTSKYEAEMYSMLLAKLDGDYKAAEGLIALEGRRRPDLGRAELIHRIVTRHERYAR
ncbi:MAG TPA: hypothetical protein VMJ64_18055 [Anaerolineales bacterium]|nr:hypothetical protein [Anaerolineales bacterium]